MSKKVTFNIDGKPVVQIKKDGETTIKSGALKFNEDVSLEEIIINLENRIVELEKKVAVLELAFQGQQKTNTIDDEKILKIIDGINRVQKSHSAIIL